MHPNNGVEELDSKKHLNQNNKGGRELTSWMLEGFEVIG
jgi:hypothetical protein